MFVFDTYTALKSLANSIFLSKMVHDGKIKKDLSVPDEDISTHKTVHTIKMKKNKSNSFDNFLVAVSLSVSSALIQTTNKKPYCGDHAWKNTHKMISECAFNTSALFLLHEFEECRYLSNRCN